MKGHFIVLEGGEGAGKSTVARFLARQFPETKLMTTCAGGTALGANIKKVLVSTEAATSSPDTQFFLAWAAHCDHVRHVVAPSVTKGVSVISDRFDSTTFAYQVLASRAPYLRKLFFNYGAREAKT